MALLSDALKDKENDIRMVQRAFGKGLVFEDEIKKNSANLPDDAEHADFVNLDDMLEEVAGQSGLRE